MQVWDVENVYSDVGKIQMMPLIYFVASCYDVCCFVLQNSAIVSVAVLRSLYITYEGMWLALLASDFTYIYMSVYNMYIHILYI